MASREPLSKIIRIYNALKAEINERIMNEGSELVARLLITRDMKRLAKKSGMTEEHLTGVRDKVKKIGKDDFLTLIDLEKTDE